MKILKKIIKWLAIFLSAVVILLGCFVWYVYQIPDPVAPNIFNESSREPDSVSVSENNYKFIGDNWIASNEWGLHEMYISGAAYERGRLAGKLSKDLIQAQEVAFTRQIKTMIPSEKYL